MAEPAGSYDAGKEYFSDTEGRVDSQQVVGEAKCVLVG